MIPKCKVCKKEIENEDEEMDGCHEFCLHGGEEWYPR